MKHDVTMYPNPNVICNFLVPIKKSAKNARVFRFFSIFADELQENVKGKGINNPKTNNAINGQYNNKICELF